MDSETANDYSQRSGPTALTTPPGGVSHKWEVCNPGAVSDDDEGRAEAGGPSFGQALKRWRADARMTQAQLARALDITQQTVSDWERDHGLPHRSRATELEHVLGLPPHTVVLAIHDEIEGEPNRSTDLAVSAAGIDLEELRRADPEAYDHVVALARTLLDRARRRAPDPDPDAEPDPGG